MSGRYLKEFFQFTRGERKGILVLLVLLVFLACLRLWRPRNSAEEPIDFSGFDSAMKKFMVKDTAGSSETGMKTKPGSGVPATSFSFSQFDPNNAGKETLLQMGVPEKVANTWLKYVEKGGCFKTKKDVKKIYGLGDDLYRTLEPYIYIEEKVIQGDSLPTDRKLKQEVITGRVELNSVDSSGLREMLHLSSVLAGRIIRYRKWLGGFYKPEQLLEVYGFSSQTFGLVKDRVIVDTLQLSRMDINHVRRSRLAGHPYLNKYQASAIVTCRQMNDGFSSLNALLDNHLLTPSEFQKIRPYLEIKFQKDQE